MRAQADQIDIVARRVVEDLAIRLTFTYRVFDRAPKVSFGRHGFLQSPRSFVIRPLVGDWVPGQLGFVQGKWRQNVQQVQLGLILLREFQSVSERDL